MLFIDASAHFEKVKNQNVLRDDDINKLVEIFRTRKTEDKYSHIALLSEIAENEYILNIPRYVDTFEEEEQVDLSAVTQELAALEQGMSEVDDTIAGLCAELGIEAPV